MDNESECSSDEERIPNKTPALFNVAQRTRMRRFVQKEDIAKISFFAALHYAINGNTKNLTKEGRDECEKHKSTLDQYTEEFWTDPDFIEIMNKTHNCSIRIWGGKASIIINKKIDWFSKKKPINLCYLNQRFSAITNWSKFAGEYKCTKCQIVFCKESQYLKHNCNKGKHTIDVYPGGRYKSKALIWAELGKFGVDVSEEEFIQYLAPRDFMTFDCESVLLPKRSPHEEDGIRDASVQICTHKCCLVSLCDSRTLKAECFIADKEDDDQWMHKFVLALNKIRDQHTQARRKRAQPILERIEVLKTAAAGNNWALSKLEKAEKMLDKYLSRATIFGWHSYYKSSGHAQTFCLCTSYSKTHNMFECKLLKNMHNVLVQHSELSTTFCLNMISPYYAKVDFSQC